MLSETQRPASQVFFSQRQCKNWQILVLHDLVWSCMILQLVKLPKREYTHTATASAAWSQGSIWYLCARSLWARSVHVVWPSVSPDPLLHKSGQFLVVLKRRNEMQWDAMRCNEMQWDAMSTCQYTSIHFNNLESLLCYVSFSLLQKHFHGLSHDFPRRRTWDKSTTLHNSRIILWGASCHALHIIWQYFTC